MSSTIQLTLNALAIYRLYRMSGNNNYKLESVLVPFAVVHPSWSPSPDGTAGCKAKEERCWPHRNTKEADETPCKAQSTGIVNIQMHPHAIHHYLRNLDSKEET